MPLSTKIDLGPDHTILDGDPAQSSRAPYLYFNHWGHPFNIGLCCDNRGKKDVSLGTYVDVFDCERCFAVRRPQVPVFQFCPVATRQSSTSHTTIDTAATKGYQSTRHTVNSSQTHVSSHSQLVTSEHITKPPVPVVIIYTPSASGDIQKQCSTRTA